MRFNKFWTLKIYFDVFLAFFICYEDWWIESLSVINLIKVKLMNTFISLRYRIYFGIFLLNGLREKSDFYVITQIWKESFQCRSQNKHRKFGSWNFSANVLTVEPKVLTQIWLTIIPLPISRKKFSVQALSGQPKIFDKNLLGKNFLTINATEKSDLS